MSLSDGTVAEASALLIRNPPQPALTVFNRDDSVA